MKEIILKVLSEIATNNSQINLQSKSAHKFIADKLNKELQPHINNLIEDIIVGGNVDKNYE